jgi:GH24 family phage-related lysozyme (muramidase)
MDISKNCIKLVKHYGDIIDNDTIEDTIYKIRTAIGFKPNQNQIDGLYSLVLDIGIDRFIKSELCRCISVDPYAVYLLFYFKAHGIFKKGSEFVYHEGRRESEYKLFRHGVLDF